MDAFDFSDNKPKTKKSVQPSSGLIWKFGSFYFLFGTVCMIVFFLYTFINPNNQFNPFPPSGGGNQGETPQPTDTPIPPPDTDADEILSLINAYRVESGLSPYLTNQTLASVAQSHSVFQASINTMQHPGQGGTSSSQRVATAGYGASNPTHVDEMIYSGEFVTPEDAVAWWKSSPIHNDIILNLEYQEIGIGVAKSDTQTFYTVNVAYIEGEIPPTATSDLPPEDPTETATLDPAVTPDDSTHVPPLPHYVVLGGSPIYLPHSSGCGGLYIAGNVVDNKGNFMLFWMVRTGGTLGGTPLLIDSLSGQNTDYSESGWEIKIADAPVASNGTVSLELLNLEGIRISDVIIIETFDDCNRNLILVNFIQE